MYFDGAILYFLETCDNFNCLSTRADFSDQYHEICFVCHSLPVGFSKSHLNACLKRFPEISIDFQRFPEISRDFQRFQEISKDPPECLSQAVTKEAKWELAVCSDLNSVKVGQQEATWSILARTHY